MGRHSVPDKEEEAERRRLLTMTGGGSSPEFYFKDWEQLVWMYHLVYLTLTVLHWTLIYILLTPTAWYSVKCRCCRPFLIWLIDGICGGVDTADFGMFVHALITIHRIVRTRSKIDKVFLLMNYEIIIMTLWNHLIIHYNSDWSLKYLAYDIPFCCFYLEDIYQNTYQLKVSKMYLKNFIKVNKVARVEEPVPPRFSGKWGSIIRVEPVSCYTWTYMWYWGSLDSRCV